ncbi:MAG: hypothetical protein ACJA0Q_000449 [Saprospiraceae bacterium]|jgi:hypothetical protein
MDIQEIITYFILFATVVYFAVRVVRIFANKKSAAGCTTGGCSGCTVKNNCGTVN